MHAKIVENMSEKLTKMVPKWSQHLSKIHPGGALEATWEPPSKQGASKTSFLTILAPFWDPLWNHFGFIWGIIFLIFLSAFLKALASIWIPKHLQNETWEGVKTKSWNCLILFLFITLWPHSGVLKIVTFDAFLEPSFGMPVGGHFGDFGSLLGSLLETILVTCWVPFLHCFLDPLKVSKSALKESGRPHAIVHAPLPPRTPPPS